VAEVVQRCGLAVPVTGLPVMAAASCWALMASSNRRQQRRPVRVEVLDHQGDEHRREVTGPRPSRRSLISSQVKTELAQLAVCSAKA
jgi:hypothetical protein